MGQSDRLIALNNLKNGVEQLYRAAQQVPVRNEAAAFHGVGLDEDILGMFVQLGRLTAAMYSLMQSEYERLRYDRGVGALTRDGFDAPISDATIDRYDVLVVPAAGIATTAQETADRMRRYNESLAGATRTRRTPPPPSPIVLDEEDTPEMLEMRARVEETIAQRIRHLRGTS